jgi:hypothetical protein
MIDGMDEVVNGLKTESHPVHTEMQFESWRQA